MQGKALRGVHHFASAPFLVHMLHIMSKTNHLSSHSMVKSNSRDVKQIMTVKKVCHLINCPSAAGQHDFPQQWDHPWLPSSNIPRTLDGCHVPHSFFSRIALTGKQGQQKMMSCSKLKLHNTMQHLQNRFYQAKVGDAKTKWFDSSISHNYKF